MDRGITVLSETPAALDMDSLKKLYRYHMSDDKTDKKQVVAEQYREYPYNKARINLVNSGVLGDISCLNISIAHEYHGFSLIRAYLGIKPDENYTVSGKIYEFPTTQTLTRYDKLPDGGDLHQGVRRRHHFLLQSHLRHRACLFSPAGGDPPQPPHRPRARAAGGSHHH